MPEELIELNGRLYPKSKVDRVYEKLDQYVANQFSRAGQEDYLEFHKSPNLVGTSEFGDVSFKRNYPSSLSGIVDSYKNPEENIEVAERKLARLRDQLSPEVASVERGIENIRRMGEVPVREAIQLKNNFTDFLNTPQSRRVLANSPTGGLDGKRASLYRKMGFVDLYEDEQLLDNRRFSRLPAIESLYTALDPQIYDPDTAKALEKSRTLRRTGRIAGMKRA